LDNMSSPKKLPSGCHSLPQMAVMGKNVRTALAKPSVKVNAAPAQASEATVIKPEGSLNFVKIDTDVVEAFEEETSKQTDASEDKNKNGSHEKTPRKIKKSRKILENEKTTQEEPEFTSPTGKSKDSQKSTTPKGKKRQIKSIDPNQRSMLDFVNKPTPEKDVAPNIISEVPTQEVEQAPEEITEQGDGIYVHIPRCVIIKANEVPKDDTLEKWLGQTSLSYDHHHPPNYAEGDLLWARVSSHPYWPCMVSKCPFSKMYTRIFGDYKITRAFHVQFFGDEVERGWINEPALKVYGGKERFMGQAAVELAKVKKSVYSPYRLKPNRQLAWDIAVDESEESLPLSREERKVQYTFDYVYKEDMKRMKTTEIKQEKEAAKKAKSTPSKSASNDNKKMTVALPLPGAKKRKRDQEKEEEKEGSPKAKRKKIETAKSPKISEGSFDEYYAIHHTSIHEQFPDWDLQQVYDHMKKSWDKMFSSTLKIKAKKTKVSESPKSATAVKKHGTLPMKHLMGSIFPESSPTESSKRGRKPSAKLLQLMTGDEMPASQEKPKDKEHDSLEKLPVNVQVEPNQGTPKSEPKKGKSKKSIGEVSQLATLYVSKPEEEEDMEVDNEVTNKSAEIKSPEPPNKVAKKQTPKAESPKKVVTKKKFEEEAPMQHMMESMFPETNTSGSPKRGRRPSTKMLELMTGDSMLSSQDKEKQEPVEKSKKKNKGDSPLIDKPEDSKQEAAKSTQETTKAEPRKYKTKKSLGEVSKIKEDSSQTDKPDDSKQEAAKPTQETPKSEPRKYKTKKSVSEVSNVETEGVKIEKDEEKEEAAQPTQPTQETPKAEPRKYKTKKSLGEVSNVETQGVQIEKDEEKEAPTPKEAASAVAIRKLSQDSDSSQEVKGKGLRETEEYELEVFKLFSTSKIDKETICAVCEKNEKAGLECSGTCHQFFHLDCVSLTAQTKTYKCGECTSGTHTCFQCKKADDNTKRCSVAQCGRYYHNECVKDLRLTRPDAKGFICPLHTCTTCTVDNTKNPKATKGRLFKCVRCPTAYHSGDMCIAAGSQILAGQHILCSNHFQAKTKQKIHTKINVTWCMICSKGGNLICCESCPASFHAECAKVDPVPEKWYCMDCESGAKPLYGNIVWMKVGNYRWWPGEVCHPRNVPTNIQKRPHQVGEFPVRFFGSHDYYWLHQGRVFGFQEGDKASKDSSLATKQLAKIYMKGVQEATEAFKLWTLAQSKKEEQEMEKSDKKPAPFKSIKVNYPIGNVQILKADVSELPCCECDPYQDNPCDSDCLNKMMLFECHPQVCRAKEKCCNQRFQKRQYPDCGPFKCEGRGWGLRCNENIKKGQFVAEYVGDLIDEEECKKRVEQAHEDSITNFYMLTLDKNRIIDAGPKGNFSRFMNHSCNPSLETQKWMVSGDIRVGLFALKDIDKGEEITFNYNLEALGNEKKACCCGADNCSGFLGVRPKTAAAIANEKKSENRSKEDKKKKKKKKKNLEKAKEHEDECFRCELGGELVMCDKINCPKVYHLACLKLTAPPMGKWLCPWHHCDDCGKIATSKCSECPNSYCAVHAPGNIFVIENALICDDHDELIKGMLELQSELPVNGIHVPGMNLDLEESDSSEVTPSHSSSNTNSTNSNSTSNGIHDSDSIENNPGDQVSTVKRKIANRKSAQSAIHQKRRSKQSGKAASVMDNGNDDSESVSNLVIDLNMQKET